jgi:hypothetical protein
VSDEPTDETAIDEHEAHLLKVLGNILIVSANEAFVIAQMEAFDLFDPRPATLRLGESTTLSERVHGLVQALGGPPQLIYRNEGGQAATYDTYAAAAVREILSSFDRARTSVLRTHIYSVGSSLLSQVPDVMQLPSDPKVREAIIAETRSRFWEHAETSFIRLASYWDRIGQLLAFAFFNIRQYERDVFDSVMDRIRSNVAPVDDRLALSPQWQRLRAYQTSEKTEGLRWLIRRRNLLIHSLHLEPMKNTDEDDPIFRSTFNHLDVSARDKLRVGTQKAELQLLHLHLRTAADLFADVIGLGLMLFGRDYSGP